MRNPAQIMRPRRGPVQQRVARPAMGPALGPTNGLDTSPETGKAYISKSMFFYNCGFDTDLAPAAPTTDSFQIDGDSDFFCTKLTVHATIADAGETQATTVIPEVSVLIKNESNGRLYMNEAIPLANIAGTAQLPFILPMVTFWARKTQITVQFFNISADDTYSALNLTFEGYKGFTE